MAGFKKSPNPTSDSNPDFQTRIGFWKEVEESDENEGIPFTPISASSKTKKKILGERKNSSNTQLEKTLKQKPVFAYDPVNNYTSPRPAFLRYNPDRRREILWRMKSEEDSDDKEDLVSVVSQEAQEDDEDVSNAEEEEEKEEEEVEERRHWCSRMVWKLLILFGVFLFSYHFLFPMSYTASPLQQTLILSSSWNSVNGDLLKTHVGSSEMCLDVGESMCEIEGFDEEVAVLSNLELSKGGEALQNGELLRSHMGFLDICLDIGDWRCGLDESLKGHFGYSEVNRVLDVEDEIEFVAKKDDDCSLNGEESVVVEEKGEVHHLSSDEFLKLQGVSDQREEIGEEEVEIMGKGLTELSTHREDLEESSPRFVLALKDKKLLIVSISLLTAITGLLSGLFNYFAKAHCKALPSESPEYSQNRVSEDSNVQHVHSNHSPPAVSVMEELRDEEGRAVNEGPEYSQNRVSEDSNVQHLHSNHSPPAVSVMEELRDEGRAVNGNPNSLPSNYATRQPVVELLGEFSLVDSLTSNAATVRTLKSKGYEESEFPQSQQRRGVGESRFSPQYEGSRNVKVNSSSITTHVVNQLVESATQESRTAKDQLEKKVTGEKSEMKKMVATPLRRSSRLQNRVTSPTP